MYLKIFNGERAGAQLELISTKTYNIGSSIDSDIIIPELPVDYFLTIHWQELDNQCIIKENIAGVATSYPDNNKLSEASLVVPIFLKILEVIIEISPESEFNTLPTENIVDRVEDEELIKFEKEIIKPRQAENYKYYDFILKYIKINKSKTYIFGAIALLLLGLGVFTILSTVNHNTRKEKANINQVIKFQFQHLSKQFGGLKLRSLQNGNYEIYGIMENESDKKYLQNAFTKVQDQLLINVIDVQTAIMQVNKILRTYKQPYLHVSYNYINKQIIINGFVSDISQINDILIDVTNQLPMVFDLDTSAIYSISDISNEFQNIVNDLQINTMTTISFEWGKSQILVNGYLTKEDYARLQEAIEPIIQKYQQNITVLYDIKNIITAIPFTIADIYTGSPAYVQTDDGTKLFEGSTYKGVTLKSINSSQVVFQGKFPIIIKINDTPLNFEKSSSVAAPKSRASILSQELEQSIKITQDESYEISQLSKLAKNADQKLKAIIDEQIKNLSTDLEARQRDNKFLNETLMSKNK